MTKARKRRVAKLRDYKCGCDKPLEMAEGEVKWSKYDVDHWTPLCLGGSEDDENLRVLCKDCHKCKTKNDIKMKAKADRIKKKSSKEKISTSKWPKRKIPSRKFRPKV